MLQTGESHHGWTNSSTSVFLNGVHSESTSHSDNPCLPNDPQNVHSLDSCSSSVVSNVPFNVSQCEAQKSESITSDSQSDFNVVSDSQLSDLNVAHPSMSVSSSQTPSSSLPSQPSYYSSASSSSPHPSHDDRSMTVVTDHLDFTPTLSLDRNNMVRARLPSKEALIVLFDSGATSSLICAKTVDSSKFLSSLPKRQVQPLKFQVGNGQHIYTSYALEIPLFMGSHKFVVEARAVQNLGGINLVIGTDALEDIDAKLEFKAHQLKFKSTSIVVRSRHNITLQPGQTRSITITGRLPYFLKNNQIMVRSTRFASQLTASQMLVKFASSVASIVVSNPFSRPVTISNSKPFGVINFNDLTNVYVPLASSDVLQDSQSSNLCMFSQTSELKADSQDSSTKHQPDQSKLTRQQLHKQKLAQYPHLEENDPRLDMYDSEILQRDVTFEDCLLNQPQRKHVQQLLLKYKQAFSLHSEIGNTNLTVDFDLSDKSGFYIRPFTVSPAEKPIIDKELEKLVKMGVLTEGHSQYSSPVMLIKKRDSLSLRLVSDFRHLNTLILKRNLSFPLLRDTIQVIGHAQPKVISVVDLKEAYFSLSLSSKASSYCGITSYYGGKSFLYKKLPQGLSISPHEFQTHINRIVKDCKADTFCVPIMDDLIIFSPDIDSHFKHVETILKAIQDNGLKMSPSKAKLFRSKVTYMGHKIVIQDGKPCITPLRERTEAIRKMPIPTTKRKLRGFIGKITFLSMYMPQLQTLLRPLHKISSKKATFVWDEETQKAYDDIIALLVKPPLLSMPTKKGLYRLYCDTSKIGVGASLWQVQQGQERLLGYFSKALPRAASNYSVTELELCGLLFSCQAYRHLLKSTTFEAFTDHSAIPQIMKAKTEPPSERIKRLLEKLSSYSMKVGYRKGKTMYIADYLSRNPQLDNEENCEIAFVVTRAQEKAKKQPPPLPPPSPSNTKTKTPPQVRKSPRLSAQPMSSQGIPATKLPKQPTSTTQTAEVPSTSGEPAQLVTQPQAPSRKQCSGIQGQSSVQVPQSKAIPTPSFAKEAIKASKPAEPAPQSLVDLSIRQRRSSLPVKINQSDDKDSTDIAETHTPAPEFLLREPESLQLNTNSVILKHVPKQSIISEQLSKLQSSLVSDVKLPFTKKELAKQQATCFYFKHIYNYIYSDALPVNKNEARNIMMQSESFIIIDSVLFKVTNTNADPHFLICLPQVLINQVLGLFHDSLLANHQGVVRVAATVKQHFYFPRLHQQVYDYIRTCSICQNMKTPQQDVRPYQVNIPADYTPFKTVYCDLKTMPPSSSDHRYILTLVCQITRYVILVPLVNKEATTVAEAILQRCVFTHGPFSNFISDLGGEMSNQVLKYLFHALKVDHHFVSVANHGANKAERHIQTTSQMLTSCLQENGKNWHLFCAAVAYAYNTFCIPSLGNYSPYYLVHLRQPPTLFQVKPTETIAKSYREYAQLLKSRFEAVGKTVLELQAKLQQQQATRQARKSTNLTPYSAGILVYLLAPSSAALQCRSRKIRMDWTGPLQIISMADQSHAILATLDGQQLSGKFHVNRLKPAFVRTDEGPANSISKLTGLLKSKLTQANKQPQTSPQITDESGNQPQDARHSCRVFCDSSPASIDKYFQFAAVNNNFASNTPLAEKQVSSLQKVSHLPAGLYDITKARLKLGALQLCIALDERRTLWLNVSDHPSIAHIAEQFQSHSARVVGSERIFMHQLLGFKV